MVVVVREETVVLTGMILQDMRQVGQSNRMPIIMAMSPKDRLLDNDGLYERWQFLTGINKPKFHGFMI